MFKSTLGDSARKRWFKFSLSIPIYALSMNIFSLEDLIFSFLRVDPKFYFINFFIFFFACFLSKQKNSVDFMAVMIVLMRMVVVFSRA